VKAITLWRPWAHAILYLGKRVENRSWAPAETMRGQTFALHAGKTWDAKSAAALRETYPEMPAVAEGHPLGVVGVARIVRVLDVRGVKHEAAEQTPWAFGPCCWMLADVVALPAAIPCSGAQGLWSLSAEVERQVSEALASMKREAPRG